MSSCFSLLLLPYPPAWARVADSGAAVLAGAVVDVDDDGAAAIAAPAAAGGALPAAFAAWGGLLLAGVLRALCACMNWQGTLQNWCRCC
eukprot:scaffold179105_cov13-Tisochrysis_lutea.AAC.1